MGVKLVTGIIDALSLVKFAQGYINLHQQSGEGCSLIEII